MSNNKNKINNKINYQAKTLGQVEDLISEEINNSLSVFKHFIKEIEIFKSCIDLEDPTQHDEIKISKEIAELIKEINKSSILKFYLEDQIRSYAADKLKTKQGKKLGKSYLFCKEQFSNIAVSEFYSCFGQKKIQTEEEKSRFFLKESEVSLLREKALIKLKERIRKKFEMCCDEKNDLGGNLKGSICLSDKNDPNEGANSRNNLKGSSKMISSLEKRKMIHESIERLYPKFKPKEKITDQICIDKINEFNRNGNYLSKKVDIQKLIDSMKFPFKNESYTNVSENIKLADEVINSYLKNKEDQKEKSEFAGSKITKISKENKSSSINHNNSSKNNNFNSNNFNNNFNSSNNSLKNKKIYPIKYFCRGDLYFEEPQMLETKSKLYIKVERDFDKLRLFGSHVDVNTKN